MNPNEISDKELLKTIKTLTLEEKAALCSGLDAWQTKPNREKGIPSLRMADGPHGVRVEDFKHKKENGGYSKPSTCFPPQATLACSWSPELCGQVGQAIAEECLHYGVGLLLGPGVNIKRSPLCGRNFEYYSEDPLLSGELAAGFIKGVQGQGVGTSLKHFAVNNQETLRMSIDAMVDDRALFDIYLKAFEIAVQKAQPDTVMASYNRVNGQYATENRRLLTEILRLRFGFKGAVVSDWGAVSDRPAGIAAGMDLEMPASGGWNDEAIVQAVRAGFLPEDALDAACWNLLRLIFRRSREGQQAPPCNWAGHHALAAEALAKSAVLLKNDGMLPLKEEGRVAIIGEMAEKPRFQGGGSSLINPKNVTSFLSAMKAAGKRFVYTPGYKGTRTTRQMLAAAGAAAKSCSQVLLFLGLPDIYETEGYDREHLRLPESQLALLDAVTTANPNVCVVLCCGSPVEAPWLDKVNSLLCLYLSGQAMGEGTLQLLYGQQNPCGKLAESWPLALEDTPCHQYFPMGPMGVTYNESIYVGYRYYNTAQKPVLFPFGYGLSYTRFSYSQLSLSAQKLAEGEALKVSFTVKNTGDVDGDEIAQVYYSRKGSAACQPAHQLCAFCRLSLPAGGQKKVTLTIPYSQFGFFHAASGKQVVEAGEIEIQAGPNSRELPLAARFAIAGVTLADVDPMASATGPYGNISGNAFPIKDFVALYKKEITANIPPQRGGYTHTTVLGLMRGSLTARAVLGIARFVTRQGIHFSHDAATNRKVARAITHDLPFKNLVLSTGGAISPPMADTLLRICNGRGGRLRLARMLLLQKKRPRR